MDDETLKIMGYVISSTYRTEVIKTLIDGPKIPSKIAADIGIKQNHISNVLNQLKKKQLIRLINPDVKKGRLYELADLGLEIAKELK
ncbi:transcriptional regulator [Methanobrevibacter sp.]|uniref:transcriptional regulator n=1 Tax=Methanobrevibacter sp. TaxID=66852 RepID=UPI0038907F3C